METWLIVKNSIWGIKYVNDDVIGHVVRPPYLSKMAYKKANSGKSSVSDQFFICLFVCLHRINMIFSATVGPIDRKFSPKVQLHLYNVFMIIMTS